MANAAKVKVEFEPLEGWGAQIGWLSASDLGLAPGLRLNRFPVFRNADTGYVDIGMPLTPGGRPASRHNAVTFNNERHHRHFVSRLLNALRVAHPEIFEPEPRK